RRLRARAPRGGGTTARLLPLHGRRPQARFAFGNRHHPSRGGRVSHLPARPNLMSQPLDLSQFQPKSELQVKETKVARPRYPVIDFHTHLSFAGKSEKGVAVTGQPRFIWPAERLLPTMDRKDVRALVNLTGGFGVGLEDALTRYDLAHPGRFYTF